MIGKTVSHYRILEKLGEGGMGVVYKAQDTKLDRIVALKFLPHHLTANDAEQARFLQEARAAATLNHPNVCTIYRIDEYEGQQFIEMEYVDGDTLRKKIPVPKIDEALRYAIAIGEALQEAHLKGIVHRDIKCENIMVNSKNQVKVMDFGLAKLKGSLKLTRTSSTVGTLAYMAPEQIQGAEADARSDIFSFGIVLFEMLAGKTPFRGDHEAAIMYSIVNEQPEEINKYRPEASPELQRIINRGLEKDPEDRYQSAADMVSELRRIQKQSARVSRSSLAGTPLESSTGKQTPAPDQFAGDSSATTPGSRGVRQPVSGAPESRAGSSGAALPVRSKSRLIYLLAGIVAVAAIAYYLFVGKQEGGEKRLESIAVLPFSNEGADPNTEYMSDGITENIINNLTRLKKLRVVPRSTVFHYKGKEVDPQKAGAELHVSAVLTGRVSQRGGDLNIQTDLIDVQQQSQLWGKQYQRRISDLLGAQDEISNDVAAQLQLQLTGEEQKTLTKRGTDNAEAYQLYLKGRYYWNKRSMGDIRKGIEFFQQSIEKDPSYAMAYSGLADCYVVLPQYSGLPAREILPKARTAAQKALEIDNSLAEAHASLAFVYEDLDWDFPSADREFKRAIELNPNYPTAHHWYAIFLGNMGRLDEMRDETEKAYQLDPLSLIINNLRAASFYWIGKYDESIAAQRHTLELDSTFNTARMFMGLALFEKKMYPEAVAEFEAAVTLSKRRMEAVGALGYAYARIGRREDAMKLVEELKQTIPQGLDPFLNIAAIYAGLGDNNAAFQWLDRAYEIRSGFLLTLKTYRMFDSLRSTPRFIAFEKKIGLPPDTVTQ
jgi:eukaryotic-like serine/threonine-protein kinase